MLTKKKFRQGRFYPTNPEKYVGNKEEVVYRSSWEHKMMRWCDNNPSVIQWNSEEVVIPYFSRADKKNRRYFMDFAVKMRDVNGDIKGILIEIKPYKETIPPVKGNKRAETWLRESYTWMVNQDKWNAAEDYAKRNNMKFIVMTEYDIGLKKRK